jgi:hypothetical protein
MFMLTLTFELTFIFQKKKELFCSTVSSTGGGTPGHRQHFVEHRD